MFQKFLRGIGFYPIWKIRPVRLEFVPARRLRLVSQPLFGLFRLGGVRLFGRFYLLARRQNCVQRGAFHPGMEFHDGALADILNQPVDDLVPKLAMGHLAATETQRRLDLVAVMEKADRLVLLGLVVVLVHRDRELDFLDDDDLLLFARRPLALVFFVEEFAVILNAANRRHGVG